MRYAALILPSANRVYAESSHELSRAELEVLAEARMGGAVRDVATETIAGLDYVVFEGPPADELDLPALARLSSLYALFERTDGLLAPIELPAHEEFDDDLVTIQRYPGKTNELFTKLLTNVTLASSWVREQPDRTPLVLDPMSGRGTTLNRVLMYGCDAAGIELDRKDFDAYVDFLKTYLQRKRVKHRFETQPGSGGKRARRMRLTLAPTKEAYKAGDTLSVDVVNADTVDTPEFFRRASVDAIVTDAPYGVQHGSHRREDLSRSPLDLIADALPGWVGVLRPGAPLGMSWNTLVAPRERLVALLADAGLEVLDRPPYTGFVHRVDQAIVRDVVVAVKPAQ